MKHLLNEINRHPQNYIFLAIIFFLTFILIYIFRFDHYHQRGVVYGVSLIYLLWSVYHHYRRGDLNLSILMEYFLLALLALIVVAATL